MATTYSGDPVAALEDLFGASKYVVGMVHLLPLPGSPRWQGEMSAVLDRAVADALALVQGGVDGVMVENFGDAPFCKGRVEMHTVSAMTMAVAAVREGVSVPVGITVLRNDAKSAMAIASVTDCQFMRVNVHVGAMVTDQGLIEGDAFRTIRYRSDMGVDVKVLADIAVKHGSPLGGQSIEQVASDTAHRGLADAIIVTGEGTGLPADFDELVRAKKAVSEVPVLVGSGVNEENVVRLLSVADGAIVGSSLKEGAITRNAGDRARVERLMAAARALR
jgi:membrane complex biogenesis BtpA family protein